MEKQRVRKHSWPVVLVTRFLIGRIPCIFAPSAASDESLISLIDFTDLDNDISTALYSS